MDKAILILVAVFTVTGAFYSLRTNQDMLGTSKRVSDHQYGALAREAAINGLNFARQSLADSYTGFEYTGDAPDGKYHVTATVVGELATVRSTGMITDTDGLPLSHRIIAVYDGKPGLQYQPAAPDFLQYALISEQTINLGGSVDSEVYLQGEEGSKLNANIHTNADLTVNGNRVRVEGYGSYFGNVSASPAGALETSFEPNYAPTEGPAVYQVDDKVEIPVYDAAAYVDKVISNGFNVIEHSGDLALSGVYNYGTRENPTIIHVTGNLSTPGSSVLNGYVMFMVDGNVSLTGNIVSNNSDYAGPDESSVAFYSGGAMAIDGTIEISAQLYSGGDVSMGGKATIYGGVATLGEAQITGSPKIYYRTPSPALAINWQDVEVINSHLVSYSEW